MAASWKARVAAKIPTLRWRDDLLQRRLSQVEELRAQTAMLRSGLDVLDEQNAEQRKVAAKYREQAKVASAERREIGAELNGAKTKLKDVKSELKDAKSQLKEARCELKDAKSQLKEARGELKAVRRARQEDRIVPTFRQQYNDMRRLVDRAVVVDPRGWHPYRQTRRKLRNYEFVASHDIAIPLVYRVWSSLEEISLDDLPEIFALKSDFGADSQGVLLLQRTSDGLYERIDDQSVLTLPEVISHFRSRLESGRVAGPYFAEELLSPLDGAEIPDDVKIYTCYGNVAQVMLRRAGRTGGGVRAMYRYLGADGEDLGNVTRYRAIDPSIPAPARLDEMVAIARHLSRALGTPFCRVDVFSTTRGIVVGELTLTPGGPQEYEPDHDAAMGAVWRDAQLKRHLDLVAGRPYGRLYGAAPTPDLYPPDHLSHAEDPGPWRQISAPCDCWCNAGGRYEQSGAAGEVSDSEPGERLPRRVGR